MENKNTYEPATRPSSNTLGGAVVGWRLNRICRINKMHYFCGQKCFAAAMKANYLIKEQKEKVKGTFPSLYLTYIHDTVERFLWQ